MLIGCFVVVIVVVWVPPGGGYIGYIIKTWLEHTFAALLTDGMIRVLCTKHFSPTEKQLEGLNLRQYHNTKR